MKQNTIKSIIGLLALLMVCGLLPSCSDWTDTETIDLKTLRPEERDPELTARYRAALRRYKAGEHFIIAARFDNAPAVPSGERDFMRCLPDSLDIVLLTNGDHFSDYDAEDMAVLHDKGTKVLYQVDYAARQEEFPDAAQLGVYLDRVVASVAENGMDGYSFTGIPRYGDEHAQAAAALLVEKLAADDGKLLVFEGDPTFIAAADRKKVDYYVLNTEKTENVTDLKMQVARALGYAEIPAKQLLLAGDTSFSILDEDKVEQNALTEITARAVSLGPLGGIGVHGIAGNYYGAERDYPLLCEAIQMLNPSK